MDRYKLQRYLTQSSTGDIGVYTDTLEKNQLVVLKRHQLTQVRRRSSSEAQRRTSQPDAYMEYHVYHYFERIGQHPNILHFYTSFQHASSLYLVSEYCSRGDFRQFLTHSLSLEQLRAYFGSIAQALHFMHEKGYAHRNLSLTNVLLDDENRPKVAGFGFAAPAFQYRSDCVGDAAFRAPEVGAKGNYIPAIADMWSLGVFLLTLLMKKPPFQVANSSDANFRLLEQRKLATLVSPSLVSTQLFDLLQQLLEINPQERIGSRVLSRHPWIKMSRAEKLATILKKLSSKLRRKSQSSTPESHASNTRQVPRHPSPASRTQCA